MTSKGGIGFVYLEIESLRQQVTDLRAAIIKHRSQKADDRCWMDDQELYAALGDGDLGDNRVGDPHAMWTNCATFIAKRCAVGGPWKSYAELEAEFAALKKLCAEQESSIRMMEPYCARIGGSQ